MLALFFFFVNPVSELLRKKKNKVLNDHVSWQDKCDIQSTVAKLVSTVFLIKSDVLVHIFFTVYRMRTYKKMY